MNSGHECEIGEFSLELLMPVKLVKCPTELRQATQAQPTASQWSRQHRAPFQLPSIIQIRKCCNEKHSGSDNSVTVSPVDFDLGTFISMSSIKHRILNRKLPCSSRSIYWLFHTCCSGLRLITFLRSSLSLPPSLEKHCHRVIMLHQRWLLEGILCTKWFKEDCGNERTNERAADSSRSWQTFAFLSLLPSIVIGQWLFQRSIYLSHITAIHPLQHLPGAKLLAFAATDSYHATHYS